MAQLLGSCASQSEPKRPEPRFGRPGGSCARWQGSHAQSQPLPRLRQPAAAQDPTHMPHAPAPRPQVVAAAHRPWGAPCVRPLPSTGPRLGGAGHARAAGKRPSLALCFAPHRAGPGCSGPRPLLAPTPTHLARLISHGLMLRWHGSFDMPWRAWEAFFSLRLPAWRACGSCGLLK